MINRPRFVPIAALLAGQLLAGVASAQEMLVIEESPPSPDYVAIPQGWVHKSCIVTVPNGGSTEELPDGTTVGKLNGKVLSRTPPCKYPFVHFHATKVSGQKQAVPANPRTSGWIESSQFFAQPVAGAIQALSGLQSSFTVPPAPVAEGQSNQTIFFFSGLVDSASRAIIQPVIQWGQGGRRFWEIQPYYVKDSTIVNTTNPTSVAPGDVIDGTLLATTCNAVGDCSWNISVGKHGSGPITMATDAGSFIYTDVRPAVLEEINITTCNQLPNTDFASFSSVFAYQPKTTSPNCTTCFEVATRSAWISNVLNPKPPGLPSACNADGDVYSITNFSRGSTLDW